MGRGNDDFGETQWAQTGGSAYLTEAQLQRLADTAYEEIRANNVDVSRIAQNTGIKPENVQKVKNHVFYDEHILDRFVDYGIPAETRRFDSDLSQANAWRRLEHGNYTPADIEWLKHETAERWYEKKHNSGYSEAHEAAQKKWDGSPWKEED